MPQFILALQADVGLGELLYGVCFGAGNLKFHIPKHIGISKAELGYANEFPALEPHHRPKISKITN